MERTFIMIKPDGVERRLIGKIISRIENKGFNLTRAKLFMPPVELVKEHYSEHKGKDFYDELVDFVSGGNVMAMIVEGEKCIQVMRLLIGDKNPMNATPGSIRGDHASSTTYNIIHGSDSSQSAEREIKLWFGGEN